MGRNPGLVDIEGEKGPGSWCSVDQPPQAGGSSSPGTQRQWPCLSCASDIYKQGISELIEGSPGPKTA